MARSIGIALLTLCLAAVCGCGGGTGTTDVTDPVVSGLAVTPGTLTAAGGSVTLSVGATDDSFVSGVAFTVTQGGVSQQVLATRVGGTYRAILPVPNNTTSATRTYSVSVQAVDAAQNASNTLTGSFTVAGVMAPPPAPN